MGHNGLYSVNCVHIAFSYKKITVLGSCQVFDVRILLQYVSHIAFHFRVRQRTQKLTLHQTIYIYPLKKRINKGMSIVQKRPVQCDSLKLT